MSELQLGFIFHDDKCIQCYGCEMACKMWRDTEPGVVWRKVLNIWRGGYPEVSCTSLSIACLHCDAPACAAVCPTQAIAKTADGSVLVNEDLCIGCENCADACGYNVPQFGKSGLMQKCDLCATEQAEESGLYVPPCVRTCPTGALELFNMTSENKKVIENEILAVLVEKEKDET